MQPKILIADDHSMIRKGLKLHMQLTLGFTDIQEVATCNELMMELADQGAAILMISSELPEILGMSDRVAVMRGGTICAVLDRAPGTFARWWSHPD